MHVSLHICQGMVDGVVFGSETERAAPDFDVLLPRHFEDSVSAVRSTQLEQLQQQSTISVSAYVYRKFIYE